MLLPGESQGWGSLVGGRLWGRTESEQQQLGDWPGEAGPRSHVQQPYSLSLLFLFIQECETSASPLIPVLSSQPEQGNRRKAGVSVVTGGDSRDTLESQRTSLALLPISASTMHLGLVSATTPHPQSIGSYPRHLALPPRPCHQLLGWGVGRNQPF